MYQHFAEAKGWKLEVTDQTPGTSGGFKQVVFKLSGSDGVYGTMKYESGVHRVQRVPQTETQGRIQTSAASVAVFRKRESLMSISAGMISVWTFSALPVLAARESILHIPPCG